jgi:hypothetical protein
MIDYINAIAGIAHSRRIANVAFDDFDGGIKIIRMMFTMCRSTVSGGIGSMNLIKQIVQNAHMVSLIQQLVGEMGTDEAGTTGD